MNESVKWTEIIQAVASVAGVVISVIGFILVWRQIRQTNENLKQSNHTAVYSINTEIYKFFASNSHLRPYFYEGKELKPGDENLQQVLSASEMLADFFEFILIEEDALDSNLIGPWEFYMTKTYRNSPAFKEFIEANKNQYTDTLYKVLRSTEPAPVLDDGLAMHN